MAEERSFVLETGAFVGLPPPVERVESVGWLFSNDPGVEGGLVGFGNSSRKATISFDLPCTGEQRLSEIGYLKSYSGMGAVRVEVGGADTDPDSEEGTTVVVVGGLWESRASVLEYAEKLTSSDVDTIRVTFEVLSADTEVSYSIFLSHVAGREANGVRQPRKFKVLHMQCC